MRRWVEMLEKVSWGARDEVKRAYRQWNRVVRKCLHDEMTLRHPVGPDAQPLPVRVVNGMPPPFAEVLREVDSQLWLLLHRSTIREVAMGTPFMADQADRLRAEWGGKAGPSGRDEILRVQRTALVWLHEIEQSEAIKKIIGIEEDVLGAYFFRVPEIRLYWVVIGITARLLGISAEALTTVVLAHQLAHAYTHLGRDIDGQVWDTERFAASDPDIIEGLAQFYTGVLCERLVPQTAAASHANACLLVKQSPAYRVHLGWVKEYERGDEVVRASMIECRSQGMTAATEFADVIEKHRQIIRTRSKKAHRDGELPQDVDDQDAADVFRTG